MTRSIGLPTRVAVGFTPGELEDDGSYHVRSLNAHAWPEVYLGGAGWVAFEPTPGRGAPGAEDYTGAPESQALPADPSTATTAVTTPTTAAAPTNNGQTSTTFRDIGGGVNSGAAPPAGEQMWTRVLAIAGIAIAAVAVLWLAVVPLAHRVRRKRRRRDRAETPEERMLVAWLEADEAIGGVAPTARRREAETTIEHARRATKAVDLPPDEAISLNRLANGTSSSLYSVRPVGPARGRKRSPPRRGSTRGPGPGHPAFVGSASVSIRGLCCVSAEPAISPS